MTTMEVTLSGLQPDWYIETFTDFEPTDSYLNEHHEEVLVLQKEGALDDEAKIAITAKIKEALGGLYQFVAVSFEDDEDDGEEEEDA